MIALMLAGLLIAGLLPLPDPAMTAADVAAMVSENAFRIRLGMIVVACGAVFLGPFISEIAVQMRRIEGPYAPLTMVQFGFGILLVFEFILPCFVCLAATYRPDRSPEITQALFDLCWLMFVGVVSTALMQVSVIAVVILRDKREQPILPRWVGWFNVWCALVFGFGAFVVFFKGGPLAWNGVLAFWIPLTVFGLWMGVMIWSVLQAIAMQERQHVDDVDAGGSRSTSILGSK